MKVKLIALVGILSVVGAFVAIQRSRAVTNKNRIHIALGCDPEIYRQKQTVEGYTAEVVCDTDGDNMIQSIKFSGKIPQKKVEWFTWLPSSGEFSVPDDGIVRKDNNAFAWAINLTINTDE
ncbi:MAG: hypothetical protein AAGF07_03785 [Patescibacteria group bacterium]